jgi:hypothetical protein
MGEYWSLRILAYILRVFAVVLLVIGAVFSTVVYSLFDGWPIMRQVGPVGISVMSLITCIIWMAAADWIDLALEQTHLLRSIRRAAFNIQENTTGDE